jgi:hypothetical protein
MKARKGPDAQERRRAMKPSPMRRRLFPQFRTRSGKPKGIPVGLERGLQLRCRRCSKDCKVLAAKGSHFTCNDFDRKTKS